MTKSGERDRAATRGGGPLTEAYFRVHEPCNARCQMCNFWTAVDGPRLEPHQILEVWDDLAALGAYRMIVTGGEPLLYEPLAKVAEDIAGRVAGFRLTVITNGSVQGPPLERLAGLSCLDTVHISLDGLSDDAMRAVRGRAGWFTRGLRTAAIIKARNPAVKIVINAILNRHNLGSLGGYLELGDSADYVNFICLKGQSPISPEPSVAEQAPQEIVRLVTERRADRIFISGDGRLDGETMAAHGDAIWGGRQAYLPCVITSRATYIDARGFVFPCNCLAHGERVKPFGNITRQRFLDIWDSQQYRGFRSECVSNRWRICTTCDPANRMENIAAARL